MSCHICDTVDLQKQKSAAQNLSISDAAQRWRMRCWRSHSVAVITALEPEGRYGAAVPPAQLYASSALSLTLLSLQPPSRVAHAFGPVVVTFAGDRVGAITACESGVVARFGLPRSISRETDSRRAGHLTAMQECL